MRFTHMGAITELALLALCLNPVTHCTFHSNIKDSPSYTFMSSMSSHYSTTVSFFSDCNCLCLYGRCSASFFIFSRRTFEIAGYKVSEVVPPDACRAPSSHWGGTKTEIFPGGISAVSGLFMCMLLLFPAI